MDEYDRLWGMRAHAISIRDFNLAAEIEQKMTSLGFTVTDIPLDDTPVMKERAVSHKIPAKRSK